MSVQELLLAPVPQKFARRAGSFNPNDRLFIQLIAPDCFTQALMPAARQILKSGFNWRVTASPAVSKEQVAVAIKLEPEADIHDQGYNLNIRSNGVEITASTAVGAFYGACTLLQIIRQSQKAGFPCMAIEDWPDIVDRGVMLDISRDKVPTFETLLHLVDLLAEMKINHLELYTEHTFAYMGHPEVWAEASPITGEEIIKLDEYCAERFIDLVPNQNSFGHMERWLKHEKYRPLAECKDGCQGPWGPLPPFSLCPTDPKSIKLIESLYDELLPHFTSSLFNVGCDETFDLGKGRSSKACKEMGEGRVYLDFLLKIHSLVEKHDRTMCFWGDIVLNHKELIPELPKDAIALVWGYEHDYPFADHCKHFSDAGVLFSVCPGTSSWNSLAGRTDNAAMNIMNAAKNGCEHGAIGLLNTDWGDNGHWQPLSVSYAGYMMGAMASWNSSFDVRKKLGDRLSAVVFQDSKLKMGNAFADIGNLYKVFKRHTRNHSIPFKMLFSGLDDNAAVDRVTADQIAEMEERLNAIEKAVKSEKSACADAFMVRKEFDFVVKILRASIAAGMARLGVRRWDRAKILAKDLLIAHEKTWLLRNRPGGFKDSAARLGHIAK